MGGLPAPRARPHARTRRRDLRLTLACLVTTVPILTHRFQFALVALILMYLITQEDTAATLLGSILGVVGLTISVGLALLAWMVVLDIAWLRICVIAAFLFGGLFLKRVLSIGALGSALGLPGALVMILPDVMTVPRRLLAIAGGADRGGPLAMAQRGRRARA